MKLSRTVTYALQATLQLAEANSVGPIPCSKLAADGGMPERFLLQILRSLVTHGILRSTRGVEGGYTLVRPPEEISVLDVIEAIEGPLTPNSLGDSGLDERALIRLNSVLHEVADGTRQRFEAIKLAEILRSAPMETA
jgi:Rrf2 family protein